MILGIDFDSDNVHLAYLPDDGFDGAEHERIRIKSPAGSFHAARNVRPLFPSRSSLEADGVWLAGIEKPMSRHWNASSALMRVQGAVLASIHNSVLAVELRPDVWFGIFTGRPKLPRNTAIRKALSVERVLELTGQAWDHDAADAFGIAFAARHLHERQTAATAAKRQEGTNGDRPASPNEH